MLGLLRSPARASPLATISMLSKKSCWAAAAPKPPGWVWLTPCGERACPALGGEAAPKYQAIAAVPDTPSQPCWGCCAAQRGASPLATISMLSKKTCWAAAAPKPPGWVWLNPCGERACRNAASPALGGEAAPKYQAIAAVPDTPSHPCWGCCAAQRGQARSPHKRLRVI